MLSYWEEESFVKYDVAVVGAGITGLSTAIELKTNEPSLSIVVLEKGLIPTGASTKNAGFACVGSLTEILHDLKSLSQEEVIELVKMRKEGLELLRKRLSDNQIDYQEDGSYELLMEDKDYTEEIDFVNHLLIPVFNRPVFNFTTKEFGFSTDVKRVISSNVEGAIDTGKMMKQLLLKAGKMGVEVKTGFEAHSISEKGKFLSIYAPGFEIIAKQVCICANAFASSLAPELRIKPGRGQVLITKPIKDLPFKGTFQFKEGFYYFRTINDRVLFGGGRNIDFETEQSLHFDLNQAIQKELELKLKQIILPNIDFEIDRRWTGIMAFGGDKRPIIKQLNKGVFAAVKLGGMGIAIGSKAAQEVARLMIDKQEN